MITLLLLVVYYDKQILIKEILFLILVWTLAHYFQVQLLSKLVKRLDPLN